MRRLTQIRMVFGGLDGYFYFYAVGTTGIATMAGMVGLGKSWFLINHNVCGTIPKAHMKQGFAGGA
jgi:hypothetical protein